MKKIFSLILTTLFICFAWTTAVAQSDPVSLLRSMADQMIAQLKAHKATLKTHPAIVYSLANSIVVPQADLDEMSQRVLPPQTWNSATPAQRAQFKKEFTTLLVRTYASALADYKDETVRFYPARGGSQGRVTVNSQIIRSDGPSISVSYSLVLRGSSWKLYDMTVEGVSMLQSFRSQFADQLTRGNIAELISVLRGHNTRHGG